VSNEGGARPRRLLERALSGRARWPGGSARRFDGRGRRQSTAVAIVRWPRGCRDLALRYRNGGMDPWRRLSRAGVDKRGSCARGAGSIFALFSRDARRRDHRCLRSSFAHGPYVCGRAPTPCRWMPSSRKHAVPAARGPRWTLPGRRSVKQTADWPPWPRFTSSNQEGPAFRVFELGREDLEAGLDCRAVPPCV
jgi:hypothetical protein